MVMASSTETLEDIETAYLKYLTCTQGSRKCREYPALHDENCAELDTAGGVPPTLQLDVYLFFLKLHPDVRFKLNQAYKLQYPGSKIEWPGLRTLVDVHEDLCAPTGAQRKDSLNATQDRGGAGGGRGGNGKKPQCWKCGSETFQDAHFGH